MALNLEELKAGGIISQRQKDLFSIRIKIIGGNILPAQLHKIADLSEKYGKGYVHITTRQGFEISHVKFDDIEKVRTELKKVGLVLGACGSRVRVVVACQGTDICNQALGDTQKLLKIIDNQFYGRYGIPHKFKIGISGCPNACAKHNENDLGFMAVVEPKLENEEACMGCGLCKEVCPAKAIELMNERPIFDYNKCFHDGKCISVCPNDALVVSRSGWQVFVGGKWGRKPQLGIPVANFVQTEQILDMVEEILSFYIKFANKQERLGELINRIGLEKFCQEVIQSASHRVEDSQIKN
jgi:dissimilatory sulfite reductase (desulfoviridin) alpha/beta subunit